MHISSSSAIAAALFAASASATALHARRDDLIARGDVDLCKAALIALKASSFCSSFVPITDVTSTSFATYPTVTVQATVTAACTPAAKLKRDAAAMPAVPTPTGSCTIKGVPGSVGKFGCTIIKDACKAYVKPKTVTTTTTLPAPTTTQTTTVTPTCPPPFEPKRCSYSANTFGTIGAGGCPSNCYCDAANDGSGGYCDSLGTACDASSTACSTNADCTAQQVCVVLACNPGGTCVDASQCVSNAKRMLFAREALLSRPTKGDGGGVLI